MILFVTTADHTYTLNEALRLASGRPARVVTYNWLFRQLTIRAACVVFTDFDRLRHYELAAAGRLFRQIRDAGIKVLNDPAKARQRYDLLHHLHAAGLNRFRAYRAIPRPVPQRFPVFIKSETDHGQDFDFLIADQAELDQTLERIEADGISLRNLLVIEFANTPVRDTVYQRRTVYRIGDTFIAGNPVGEDSPFVKYGTPGLTSDEEFDALAEWMRANPDAETLKRAFEIARIDYGRADYGNDDGSFAIYEINTNPKIGTRLPDKHADFLRASQESLQAVIDAIVALDGEDRTVHLQHDKKWFSRLRFRAGFFLKMP